MQRFRVAPFGVTAWVWTLGFIGGAAFFLVRSVNALAAGVLPDLFDVGAGSILMVLVVWGWIRSVRAYSLVNGEIVVERLIPTRMRIPISSANKVQLSPGIGAFFNVGFISIGGLFGWAGKANVRNPGDSHSLNAEVYGTNPRHAVTLQLESGRTLILTPADPVGFVEAVRQADLAGRRSRIEGRGPIQANRGGSGRRKKR